MLSAPNSNRQQPTVSLGVPDTDIVSSALMWVFAAVAGLFFVTLLLFAVINADDEGSEEDAFASVAAQPLS